MAANLKILVPEATENYVQNPSLRYDTAGYTAVGATLSRVLSQSRFGVASLKVVTNGAAIREGFFYRVNTLAGISDFITVSAYVRGNGRVHIRLIDNPSGKEWSSPACALQSDRWVRIQVTGQCTGRDDMRLYVETDSNVQAITFYADGMQMERKPYATSYCDGNQPGCRWNVVDHGSNSTRDPYTRTGGKWLELAGPCRADDDIYVTVLSGMGMPPLTNNAQSFAIAPGSFFQNIKIKDRVVTLNFTVKKKDLHWRGKADLSPLHNLRQQLIDVIKPGKTAGGEPFLFSYQEGDREVFVWLRYDAGLDGQWDLRNQWVNSFPLRLVANSPLMFEDSQNAAELSFSSRTGTNYIIARKNGEWVTLNVGLNDYVADIALGRKRELVMTGNFYIDYSVTPPLYVNRITSWDGSRWSAFGSGAPVGSTIKGMAVAPNGDIYVTGAFAVIGGVACNNVAKWNGSSWNALGSGLNSDGEDIAVAPNGDVYVGGRFTTAGGINAYRIARWDGAWHSIGAYGGVDDRVVKIAITKDGNRIYFSGRFQNEYSIGTNLLKRVASYNPATNLISTMGLGFDNWVDAIAISPATDDIYAAGYFANSGSTPISCVAKWTGSQWIPLGQGLTTSASWIAFFSDGRMLVAGGIVTADGHPVQGAAIWNGSCWTGLDALIDRVYTVFVDPNDDIYMGIQNYVTHSTITYVTNSGSCDAKPTIYIKGAGKLRFIENQTAKKRIYFDLDIFSTEEVFIDFGRSTIVSTLRGDLNYTLLPGSDFSEFALLPGENKIACLLSNDVGAQMSMQYVPQHWSADATVEAEALQ